MLTRHVVPGRVVLYVLGDDVAAGVAEGSGNAALVDVMRIKLSNEKMTSAEAEAVATAYLQLLKRLPAQLKSTIYTVKEKNRYVC